MPDAPDLALISPYPRTGLRHDGDSGVASYTANLAHALAETGLSVCVVAPELDGEPARSYDGPVEVRRAFRTGRPTSVAQALDAAAATGAAQVHLQLELFLYGGATGLPVTLAALARRRRTGPPVTVTLHQVVDPAAVDREYTAMHRIGVPPVAARAALATVQRALPKVAADVVVHEPSFVGHVPGAQVVPHGIEVPGAQQDKAGARRRLGLDDEEFLALCFGFVAPYKGLETALAAAEQAGPGVRLVVAGGEHPRLAAQGDDYAARLQERFGHVADFTGFVPDEQVADWFRAADVLLLCYPEPHASSGPLALALAHGTPVQLSERLAAVVGAPDLAVPTEEWSSRLDRLATHGDDVHRLRARVHELAAGRTWPAVARRHLDLYGGLREHRPRPADRALA
jgi:glycosyltransferase involved in cell wall biosynthesis